MRNSKIAILFSLMVTSISASAMGFTVEQGKTFTNLNMEIGKTSSGVYLESNWLKNTKNGSQIGGAGLGYNLEFGPIMINAGTKATYLGPKKGDNGIAFPVGGGITIAFTDTLNIYGEGYSAPKGLTNSVKNYVEANGGISWTPFTPLTLKLGYRHASVDGKDGRPGHTIIDGPYFGGGLTF